MVYYIGKARFYSMLFAPYYNLHV